MFAPIAPSDRKKVTVAIAMLALGSAFAGYALVSGHAELCAPAFGLLGGLIGVTQWFISQARESAKIRWEAVRTYYAERDVEPMTVISREIFAGNFERAAAYCNFFEKWGRLARMEYMPDEIFHGSTGVHIVNAFVRLYPFIRERQAHNQLYASSFLWLVNETVGKESVIAHVNSKFVKDLLGELNVA